ncbi:PilT/PilU family type 4a pilus ATPase [Candidatus Gracilibacteria bacterium]|nr:PilT/PilU family type 4a pilus ATPase [Candidatus Gracilibacteria bacterium]
MQDVIKTDHPIRDQLLQVMIDNKGSDLYITVGTFPAIKIAGEITSIDEDMEAFTWKDTFEFAQSIVDENQMAKLDKEQNLDFSFSFAGARFRGNLSFQMGNYMVVVRLLNSEIPDIETLGLTDIYKNVTKLGQGLILITGPTGSGKTTTLAAMINFINTNYKKHIITIEDPIEYVHKHKNSIIEQKEVGKDVPDYETALIGAMRQAPQVILFGEMRNKREVEMALTLAETGHLVFSTLHTRSAAQTISRVIDIFSENEKDQVRMQLSDALVAVFSQRLLTRIDGTGVHMVKEILVNNSAVSNLIRENDIHQIPTAMQMGKREGMQLLEDDILKLIQLGEITEEEGVKYANNPRIILEQRM